MGQWGEGEVQLEPRAEAVTVAHQRSRSHGDASTREGSRCVFSIHPGEPAGRPGATVSPFHGWGSRTPRVWPIGAQPRARARCRCRPRLGSQAPFLEGGGVGSL